MDTKVRNLINLKSLNPFKSLIPHPVKGKPIHVFGLAHAKYLFTLTNEQQALEIKKHKLTLELEDLNRQSKALDEKRKSLEKKSKSLIDTFGKEIEEKSTKTALPAKQCSKGFRGAYQCFSITPSEKNLASFVNFLLGSKKETKRLLREKLLILKNLKFNLVYIGHFVLGVGLSKEEKEAKKQIKYFHSSTLTVHSSDDVDEVVDTAVERILNEISEFQQYASGWHFVSNVRLDVAVYKYRPVRGSSYIPLPPLIANKKACINVKNNDQECFKYSVLLHLHPGKNHDRVSVLKKFHDFDAWKGSYPMKRADIPKFEKQFNLSINVYAYEKTEKEYTFYPWYVTDNILKSTDNLINLLLVQEKDNAHYVLIKSLPALVYSAYAGHGAVNLCPCCFKNHRTKEKLEIHLHEGCAKFGERTVLPSVDEAQEYVRFNKLHKMLKKPFVIYADFESILQANQDDRGVKSKQYQKHVACGYSFKRVATLDKYDKDIVLFRGTGVKDVAEHFISALLKEADEIREIMKNIIEMKLSKKQQREHNAATCCYLCNGEFGDKKKKIKVRDHDHLTGEYRGAAHQACNINYGWRHYKIPVLFHNLKGYDSHFIVKALNDKCKSLSCIPSSTEKFITFGVNNLEFIDSMSFIQASLERLVGSLSQNNLGSINSKFKHFLNF